MKVFVLNKHGKPLMPTTPRKARLLLKEEKAKIVSHSPFTIRLLYGSSGYKQKVKLGIDAGYKTIGFSAVSQKDELVSGEVKLLENQSERIRDRAVYRRQRRNRKRYRPARFDNRKRKEGWLAPSIQHKLESHIRIVNLIKKIVPVTEIVIEVASFDIQAIKNPDIEKMQYQQGKQSGFWNLREYILHRDKHQCQSETCQQKKTQPKNQALAVHHIGYWKKDRTDRPENLITLCSKCHSPANHKQKGSLYGWEPTVAPFRGETFMSQVRWRLVNKLEHCRHTYGYQTKSKRIDLELEKTHYNDAFVIAGGQRQNRTEVLIFQEKRKNNRCLEKFYDAKFIDIGSGKKVGGADLPCGRVKRNKGHEKNGENLKKYRGKKVSKGRRQIRKQRYPIQPHDVVKYNGNFYRAVGIQNKGKYLKMSDGTDKIVKNIKDIEIVFHQKTLVLIDAISM
ncbi:RNA-guided endonuclease IscB [Desulfobacter latus]|uniref:HNH endonuclease n=1 Tax=Desulfobacter latus TaxID=2292 RepID=A0A850T3K6_9BACT|nr:RNA-guided endonuclease IscB [Desulfobacter latus]NWH06950.1 HNH endonuclease [Desulfobacter latus]